MTVTSTTLCGLSGGTFSCSGGPGISSSIPGQLNGSTNVNVGGVFGLGGLLAALLEVLGVLILVAVVGVFVIIVVANRADADPSGRRPQSVYYFAVSFITLASSIVGRSNTAGS